MANYLGNSQDFIPALQPFQPDLNYYSGVLSTKQSQYDEGLSKLNSIYGSALNSPLTGQDNIERRQKYFQTIEQDIQKAAQLDLSIDQNVNFGKKIFDPLLNDKDIVNDILFTKKVDNAYKTGERYRYCADPEKCQGSFWDQGLQAINYSVDEFQRASPEERLRMRAPEYVPFQNVSKLAMKAAKEAGFNVANEYNNGGYDVTDTNGYLLLDRKDKDGKLIQGVLPQYLYGVFGNDPSIQKMNITKAYVDRKNYSKANAHRFVNGEDGAEQEYLDSVLPKSIRREESSKEDLDSIRESAQIDKDVLEGNEVPGPGIESAYEKIAKLVADTDKAYVNHEQTIELINTTPNLEDRNALRNRVDGIVANSYLLNDLDAAAYEYAMGTSKHELKADPYKLESFKAGLDISKAKQLKDYDQGIWERQQMLLGNIEGFDEFGNGISRRSSLKRDVFSAMNKIPEDVLLANKITKDKAGVEKAIELGILNKEEAKKAQDFVVLDNNDPYENIYFENSKVTHQAAFNAFNISDDFVKVQVANMQNSFKNADATYGVDKAVGIKAKLLVDMKTLLGGYLGKIPQDYNALMRGETELNLSPEQMISASKRALDIRQKNVAARVYNDDYSSADLLKIQAATTVATGLYNIRNAELKEALRVSKTENLALLKSGQAPITEGTKITSSFDAIQYQKKEALLSTIANLETGIMTDPVKSKLLFIQHAAGLFGQNNKESKSAEEESYRSGVNKKAYQEAANYFDENYGSELKKINSRLTPFKGAPESTTTGGAVLSKYSVIKNFKGNQPLDPNTVFVSNLITDIANNPEGKPVVITGIEDNAGQVKLSTNDSDPVKAALFQKIVDKLQSDKGKDLNISTDLQFVPTTYNSSGSSEEINNAIYRSPGDLRTLPGETTLPTVFVKMTIPEEDYRQLNYIKNDTEVSLSERTLVVKTQATNDGSFVKSLDPFIQGIQDTPEEIYLSKVGRSLPLDLGGKGSAIISRIALDPKESKLQIKANVPIFNESTGDWDTGTISYFADSPNMDLVYSTLSSQLDKVSAVNKQNQLRYAQSNKSK